MIVGREQLIYFEQLGKQQKQVYPDAADYGVIIANGSYDYQAQSFKAEIGKNARYLMETFKHKTERWTNGAALELNIPFEMDEGVNVGVTLRLSFTYDKPRKLQFMSVDINRWIGTEESPFLND